MAAERIQVLTVEDDPSFRQMLAVVLGACGRFHVRAAEVERWQDDVCTAPPDVLMLDLILRGEVVAPAIPRIVSRCPTTMVAVLTHRTAEYNERSVCSVGAFTSYDKEQLDRLPDDVEHDLTLFRQALAGDEVIAPAACGCRSREAWQGPRAAAPGSVGSPPALELPPPSTERPCP